MSSKKKILEEVLPLRLIKAVEKWPVLYMKDCPERNNAHFRNKVWQEIAKGLIENWENLAQVEKELKAVELCRKWRNLRDTFKRQLAIDKKVREGQDIKRKEYVYYKHMTFLLPHVTVEDEPRHNKTSHDLDRRKRPVSSNSTKGNKKRNLSLDEIDEDEHFLMSLLPSFKRMSDDEKLTAKVEILKVIREVRNHTMTQTDGLMPVLEVNGVYEPREDVLGFSDEEVTVKKEIFAVEINEDDNSSERSAGNEDSE